MITFCINVLFKWTSWVMSYFSWLTLPSLQNSLAISCLFIRTAQIKSSWAGRAKSLSPSIKYSSIEETTNNARWNCSTCTQTSESKLWDTCIVLDPLVMATLSTCKIRLMGWPHAGGRIISLLLFLILVLTFSCRRQHLQNTGR